MRRRTAANPALRSDRNTDGSVAPADRKRERVAAGGSVVLTNKTPGETSRPGVASSNRCASSLLLLGPGLSAEIFLDKTTSADNIVP
jgi:hypothetical protein